MVRSRTFESRFRYDRRGASRPKNVGAVTSSCMRGSQVNLTKPPRNRLTTSILRLWAEFRRIAWASRAPTLRNSFVVLIFLVMVIGAFGLFEVVLGSLLDHRLG